MVYTAGVLGPSHFVGTGRDALRRTRSRASPAVDCPITTSGAAPLIVDGFRRVRRSTFTGGAIMEGAECNRHSRARVAETAKDASRHATPDAPECIDHRRRCTRHDHRTYCRGSRGSASLPCHVLRKTRRNVPLHQGFFAEMQSIHPHSGSNPRVLCLTNVSFGRG